MRPAREFVLAEGQTMKEGLEIWGQVRCPEPECEIRVLTQPVILKNEREVIHQTKEEKRHRIGWLEQRDGKWFVREAPPTKRQRKLKSTYRSVWIEIVINPVGRGKRQ